MRVWSLRHRIGAAGTLAIVVLVALPALAALGHPVLAYASSASMEPTLGVGDVFVLNPFVREPSQGDVIAFQTVERDGALTVHRVVGGDRHGYETRGDANPVTDQSAGEPFVTPDRIHGRVVTLPWGEPLVLPKLGLVLIWMRVLFRALLLNADSYERLAAGALLVLGLVGLLLPERRAPGLRPPRLRPPHVVRALRRLVAPRGIRGRHTGVVVVVALAALGFGASLAASHDVPIALIVTEGAIAGDARMAPPGGSVERLVEVRGTSLLSGVVVVEASTPGAVPHESRFLLGPSEVRTTAVSLVASDAPGLQREEVRIYRYPAVLPSSVILALHEILPGAPAAVPAAALVPISVAWLHALAVADVPFAAILRGGGNWRGPP